MGDVTDRLAAYYALTRVEEDEAYSNIALDKAIKKYKPERPGFVRSLVKGVLRNQYLLDYYLNQFLKKGTEGTKRPALIILRMGFYQLLFMDEIPAYSAVAEMVKLTKRVSGGSNAFINGVLRSVSEQISEGALRSTDDIKKPVKRASIKYSFSREITALLFQQYGEDRAISIMESLNAEKNPKITVNLCKTSPDELIEDLKAKGITASKTRHSDMSLAFEGPGLQSTEEYLGGKYWVQDTASVMAISALGPKPGDRILDVCAAPGGKSFLAAALSGGKAEILSLDKYQAKIDRMKKEAARLGLGSVTCDVHNAIEPVPEWLGSFDKVICDVPCTGLGVVRSKPEIKLKTISPADLKELKELQLEILRTSAEYLKPGGLLCYSTCTINQDENERTVDIFLKKQDCEIIKERTILPDEADMDGFYYCIIRKA